jgi:hypothetical protein
MPHSLSVVLVIVLMLVLVIDLVGFDHEQAHEHDYNSGRLQELTDAMLSVR